jgi:tetratricopeptide (TPR) repeat protein
MLQLRVRQQFQTGRPSDSFRILRQEAHALSPKQRAQVTREAVNDLAFHVKAGKNPITSLAEVRRARADGGKLDGASERALEALEARLQDKALSKALNEVGQLGPKGRWRQAGNRAQETLDLMKVPAPAAKALAQVAKGGKLVADLDRVEVALSNERLATESNSLRQLNIEALPVALKQPVKGLRALAELQAAGKGRWQRPPGVPAIQGNLADFQAQAGDGNLTARWSQDLASQAFLDGFPAEARLLLPAVGAREHAGALLRDMRRMILNEAGRVSTAPAQHALAAAPGAGAAAPPELPRGIKALIPEAEQDGWRPPVQESAREDLPSLEPGANASRRSNSPREEAGRLEKPWREQALRLVTRERAAAQREVSHALHQVHQFCRQMEQDDEEDRKLQAEVEAELARPLTAAERALAWHLHRQEMVPPVVGASTVGLIGSPLGQSPLGAASALVRGGARGASAVQIAALLRQGAQGELDCTEAYIARAAARYERKEYDLAIADYTAAIRLAPTEETGYRGRGNAYLEKGDYDVAIANFNMILDLRPAPPPAGSLHQAYADRADAYARKRDYANALADFDKAIELEPRPAFYLARGRVHAEKRDYDKALADFDQAARREAFGGRDWSARNEADRDRAAVCIQQGDYEQAIAAYDKLIQAQPNTAKNYVSRGDAFCLKKAYDQAHADYDRAIHLEPGSADALTGRGTAYRKRGNYAQAFLDYTAALEIDPACASAHAALGRLLATCPNDHFRDGVEALEHARKACETPGTQGYLCLEALAAAHAENRAWHQAAAWLKRALECANIPGGVLPEVRQRLALYEQQKPYREHAESKQGPEARDVDGPADESQAPLEARRRQRVLVQDLKVISELGRRGLWSQAGSLAKAMLKQRDHTPTEAQPLSAMAQVGAQRKALDLVEAALNSPAPRNPAATAAILRQIRTTALPPALRKPVSGLAALAELQAAANGNWQHAPDVASLQDSLADFQAQSQDKELTVRVQQELCVLLFFDGFPAQAHRLLPPDGPPNHAADLLRHARAFAVVDREPGIRSAGQTLGARLPGLHQLGPLPGLQLLFAEAHRAGRRLAHSGSALDEASRLEKSWREQVMALVTKERLAARPHAAHALQLVVQLQEEIERGDMRQRQKPRPADSRASIPNEGGTSHDR